MPARVRPADLGFEWPLKLVPRARRGALTAWGSVRGMMSAALEQAWLVVPVMAAVSAAARRLGTCPARRARSAAAPVRGSVVGLAARAVKCPVRRLGWLAVPVMAAGAAVAGRLGTCPARLAVPVRGAVARLEGCCPGWLLAWVTVPVQGAVDALAWWRLAWRLGVPVGRAAGWELIGLSIRGERCRPWSRRRACGWRGRA